MRWLQVKITSRQYNLGKMPDASNLYPFYEDEDKIRRSRIRCLNDTNSTARGDIALAIRPRWLGEL